MIQHPYTVALFAILGVGVASWVFSVITKDVSFVDSLWSLFFLLAAVVFAIEAQPLSVRLLSHSRARGPSPQTRVQFGLVWVHVRRVSDRRNVRCSSMPQLHVTLPEDDYSLTEFR